MRICNREIRPQRFEEPTVGSLSGAPHGLFFPMISRFTFALLSFAALLTAGCAHRDKKPDSRIYAGESPSLHYSNREAAGGPLGGF